MTEKQLISKIKELKQIKPRNNWVFLTKKKILGADLKKSVIAEHQAHFKFNGLITGLRFVLGHKLAFASLVILIFFLIGTFNFVQNALPGDYFYAIKKIVERGQMFFTQEPIKGLELANKRLDDLTKIAQSNSVENLASAINEYKGAVSDAARSLAEQEPELEEVKEIALEIKKLEENRQKVEALGVLIDNGAEELNNVLAELVERELKELEKGELTPDEELIIEEIKQDQEQGNYFQALENILILSNNE